MSISCHTWIPWMTNLTHRVFPTEKIYFMIFLWGELVANKQINQNVTMHKGSLRHYIIWMSRFKLFFNLAVAITPPPTSKKMWYCGSHNSDIFLEIYISQFRFFFLNSELPESTRNSQKIIWNWDLYLYKENSEFWVQKWQLSFLWQEKKHCKM